MEVKGATIALVIDDLHQIPTVQFKKRSIMMTRVNDAGRKRRSPRWHGGA